MSDLLQAQNLTLAYSGNVAVISGLDLAIAPGRITALVGPNGCGKSTLLRGLARTLQPVGGAVLLNGVSLQNLDTRDVARRIALLPQGLIAPEGVSVAELVLLGRNPHRPWWRDTDANDRAIAADAMRQAEVYDFRDAPLSTLSGGQQQRVWVAMALAQQTSILLLDEPTTFLDMSHQQEILSLLQRLRTEQDKTIAMVLHDLNHAARFADTIVMMRNGSIHAEGAPRDVLTPGTIRQVFEVDCEILADPATGGPLCVPMPGSRG